MVLFFASVVTSDKSQCFWEITATLPPPERAFYSLPQLFSFSVICHFFFFDNNFGLQHHAKNYGAKYYGDMSTGLYQLFATSLGSFILSVQELRGLRFLNPSNLLHFRDYCTAKVHLRYQVLSNPALWAEQSPQRRRSIYNKPNLLRYLTSESSPLPFSTNTSWLLIR